MLKLAMEKCFTPYLLQGANAFEEFSVEPETVQSRMAKKSTT
jgi:hypothetical protein